MGSDIKINMECSEEMKKYFIELKTKADHCYNLAVEARKKGLDPELEPEIIMTEDLAARVEGLVGPPGIATRIREVAKNVASREILSLTIAEELVKTMSSKGKQEAVEQAVRTGLAILTEGVLVAPLEGIAKVEIEKNLDGTEFLSIFFAGPIRSAGGTGQALSVLIADVVRRGLGLDRYKPTNAEIERMKEEISLYKRRQHLQYDPSPGEIETIISSCPVCVDGEGTEDEEVSGYRNIARIKTARVRGGACLVIAEGLCLKALKIQKIVKQINIDGWEFIDKIVNKKLRGDENSDGRQDDVKAGEEVSKIESTPVSNPIPDLDPDDFDDDLATDTDVETLCTTSIEIEYDEDEVECESIIKPNEKYMRDMLAGRAVFANPSQKGGFRLRYGRARTTGLAAIALNPSAMYILGEFLAIGTQLKIERPGKAGVVTSCDEIEGPIVLLKDQSMLQIQNADQAMKIRDQIDMIIDLGEILIPFGEFVENNHDLVPGAYDINWWIADLDNALKNNESEIVIENLDGYRSFHTKLPTAEEAFEISKELNIPLHPRYNLFWHDISIEELKKLQKFISEHGEYKDGKLYLPNESEIKSILIELCALHIYDKTKDQIIFDQYSLPLVRCLGLNEKNGLTKSKEISKISKNNVLKIITELAGIRLGRRGPTRIGASMGRPEKAKERMMKPPVHILFPLGNAGGTQRLVKTAAENSKILIEAGTRHCQSCGARTIFSSCACGGHTIIPPGWAKQNGYYNANEFKQELALRDALASAQKNVNELQLPDMKGVIGLISEHKTPEPLEKGILRAKQGVYVFKDGTIRFDMTDVPLTHFKPSEIGTSIEKLHELGYTHDHKGEPLSDNSQIVELKPQDLIPSKNAGKYLLKVSKFLDDLLTKFYHMDSYYNANSASDLIGHIMLGLSPHTSGAVLGRLIGYTQSRVGYAHPFYHAAKRRNCDGDEDCIMLALDGLINFSKSYLPGSRGGFMDAPLVLMTYINPNEIDKEAQNVDIVTSYPRDFYLAAERFAKPKELESLVETVSNRIGTAGQFENFGFMFDTSDINIGPEVSSYTTLGGMIDKMEAQLELAKQIRAVDERLVAARVIESHFLPDMIGNLRSFSKQSFRCPKCRAKYRRIPLQGVCIRRKPDGKICGNKLTMTVHKGGVKKYLEVAKDIAEKYNVPKYTQQRISLNKKAIDSTFENDKVKKFTLDEFI